MLTRDSFLTYAFPAAVAVEIPALAGTVEAVCLTAGKRDEFEVDSTLAEGKDFRARTVVYCAYQDGKPLFTKADIPWLSGLPPYVLDPIVHAAVKLNRFTAGEIAELEKN